MAITTAIVRAVVAGSRPLKVMPIVWGLTAPLARERCVGVSALKCDDAVVASVAVSGRRRRGARPASRRRGLQHRHARLQGLHRRLVGRFGKLNRPRGLVARVDFEEAGAVITARQAIVGPADGELLFPRAHEGLAGPFPAAIVVHGGDVIQAINQAASQYGLAATCGNVPPALGGPALVLLVADGDADPVAGIVAESAIGLGGDGRTPEFRDPHRRT